MANRIQNEYIKHVFSPDETLALSSKMAQKVTTLHEAEDEKKAIMSDFKSQIDGLTAEVNSAATKINNGYEMRNIECEHKPDYDQKIWIVVRCDTGEPVKELPMSEEDFQMSLDDIPKKTDPNDGKGAETVKERIEDDKIDGGEESNDLEIPDIPDID